MQQSPVSVSERELLCAVAEGLSSQRHRATLPPTWERAKAALADNSASAFDILVAALVNEICTSAAAGEPDTPAHDLAFNVCEAIRTTEQLVTDLQNVIAALSAVETQHAIPEWHRLTWRPVVTGLGEWRLEVEQRLSKGWIKRHYGRFVVNQVGFDQVGFDTLEEACDLLLQREWSTLQAARVQAALAERRAMLISSRSSTMEMVA